MVSRAVLVTGCSSGIGRATAARLARAGWTVYATARRPETLEPLAALGCRTLGLDVTQETSMRDAVSRIEEEEGAVGGLVNNAGYSQNGALETLPIDLFRRQLETNVVGLLRLCQLVLPGMRAQGWGRIVNVSSMGGRLTLPGAGAYHASKHAVEALSDALRFEVAGFGVDVVVVEPGLVATDFGDAAEHSTRELGDAGLYADFEESVTATTQRVYAGSLRSLAKPPDAVARAIERALSARRPRTRYRVTVAARAAIGARRVLPDRAWDVALRLAYPRPGPGRERRK